MKIVGVIIATVGLGFIAFQNCQKAPQPSDVVVNAVDTQDSSDKIDLQSQKILDITLSFAEVETVARASGSYQINVNKDLKISLPSGEMILSSDLDGSTTKYCLTETLTNELVSILKSSQICKQTKVLNPDQVCTQVMKMPYAIITTESDSFSLGSASDGCGSNSIDLCGEQVQMLQGFIATLKNNYKTLVCTQ